MRLGNALQRIPLVKSLKGYSASSFRDDVFAGVVIAALTIPLSMGYAEVAGVPPEYGLYAAMLTAALFALFTSSRNIVFGMDSATAAVTGSAIANLGVAWGSGQAVQAMPFLALVTAAFVAAFFLLRLGRFAEKIPTPVMHGFVLGIACVVIIGQLPKVLGLTVAGTSAVDKLVGCAAQIGSLSAPALLLAVCSIAAIVVLERVAPKFPGALAVLVVGTLVAVGASTAGVTFPAIGELEGALPEPVAPHVPSGDFFGMLGIVADAFTIAFVMSIESLLCFRTFARAGTGPGAALDLADEGAVMNRELGAAAAANGIAALFACPPGAASLSRTAAAMDAGGTTQVASLVGAFVVLLAVLFLSPVLVMVPEAVLAAIVVCAMAKLPDFTKISRYFQHMRIEFLNVIAVAAIVFVFGAAHGVLIGLVATAISDALRRRGTASRKAVFGVIDRPDEPTRSKLRKKLTPDQRVQAANYVKMTFGNRLVFSNASTKTAKALEILARIPVDVPLVLGLSKIRMVDASANDEILSLIDAERARGRKVYCIRKLALANDTYTRYELRRVFGRSDGLFSSKRDYELWALESAVAANRADGKGEMAARPGLADGMGEMAARPGLADGKRDIVAQPDATGAGASDLFVLPQERPVFTLFIAARHEALKGALVYIKARETVRFIADVAESADGEVEVSRLVLTRKRARQYLGTYANGEWDRGAMSQADLDTTLAMVRSAVSYPVFLEEFDGIEIEEPFGMEFEL
ncbi:MAG: SulP family inorganic anion transporter [Coriobacteriaceae bacterium]|nr:SulP family inorganic anion transporter [Coriobacteriaceae bacterium]